MTDSTVDLVVPDASSGDEAEYYDAVDVAESAARHLAVGRSDISTSGLPSTPDHGPSMGLSHTPSTVSVPVTGELVGQGRLWGGGALSQDRSIQVAVFSVVPSVEPVTSWGTRFEDGKNNER